VKYIKTIFGLFLIGIALTAMFRFGSLSSRFMFLSGDGQVVPHTLLQLRICLVTLGIVGLYMIFSTYFSRLLFILNNYINNLDRKEFLKIFVLVAVGLRIAVVIFMPFRLWIDYMVYDELAWHWVQVGGYYVGDLPTAYRPPGYPFFLSRIYWIFGHHPLAGAIANIFLSTAIVVLAYMITRRIWTEIIARWTMIIITLFPGQLLFVNLLASEPLFTFLFLSSIYLFIIIPDLKRKKYTYLMIGGVILGLATLTRSITIYYLIIPAIFWSVRQKDIKKTAVYTLIALIGLSIAITPWMIRNYHRKGAFIISTNRGINLLIGNQPGSGMGWNQPVTEEFPIGEPEQEMYVDSVGWSRGWDYIKNDIPAFLKRGFLKTMYFYAVDMEGLGIELVEAAENNRIDRYVIMALIAESYYIMVLLFALMGVVQVIRYKQNLLNAGAILFILTILYWTAVHFVFFADGRFHFPVIPMISALAAIHIHSKTLTGNTKSLPRQSLN